MRVGSKLRSANMASDLVEEMESETKISGDIRDLLPRDGLDPSKK